MDGWKEGLLYVAGAGTIGKYVYGREGSRDGSIWVNLIFHDYDTCAACIIYCNFINCTDTFLGSSSLFFFFFFCFFVVKH